MTTRVKICGITTPQDAAVAAALGADAIGVLVGLVHASEDEVPLERAAEILRVLPPFVAGTLVTHRSEPEEVRRLCGAVQPSVLQLHGDFAPEAMPALREEFRTLRIIKTVHVETEAALERARQVAPYVDAILLDTRTAARIGGTGLVHDWSISRRIRDALTATPLILAGGLSPANVAGAIERVRPYAVDVNSGVSLRRGVKSADLMARFIHAAK
jgi:phosphoribosylanthranilate isomerase